MDYPNRLILDTSLVFLEEVLEGKISALSFAFMYDSTPQGYGHWFKIRHYQAKMTPRDYAFLWDLRKQVLVYRQSAGVGGV